MLKWLKCCYAPDNETSTLINKNLGQDLLKEIKAACISMQTTYDSENQTMTLSVQQDYVNRFPKCVVDMIKDDVTLRNNNICKINIDTSDIDLCNLLIAFCKEAITPPANVEKKRRERSIFSIELNSPKISHEPTIDKNWVYSGIKPSLSC